jgi:hypothetical protein
MCSFLKDLLSCFSSLLVILTPLSLSIAMIVMGALNKNTCVDQRISIWLIVTGSVRLIHFFGSFIYLLYFKEKTAKHFRTLVFISFQIWIIFGNVWIYSVNRQDILTDHSQCYNFSFGMITFFNVCLIYINSFNLYKTDITDVSLD